MYDFGYCANSTSKNTLNRIDSLMEGQFTAPGDNELLLCMALPSHANCDPRLVVVVAIFRSGQHAVHWQTHAFFRVKKNEQDQAFSLTSTCTTSIPKIAGSIPPTILQLPALRNLNLERNNLKGEFAPDSL